MEILRALTFHLASPSQKPLTDQTPQINRSKSAPIIDTSKLNSEIPAPVVVSDSECNVSFKENGLCVWMIKERFLLQDPAIKFFDKMADDLNNHGNVESLFQNDDDKDELLEQLIANEENYIANVLLKCLKFCPNSFGAFCWLLRSELIRFCSTDNQPSKDEVIKWVNRGTSKLWAQVGSTLEHIVLWWSDAPLACRPVACAKYLRDWLLMIQSEGSIQNSSVPRLFDSLFHFFSIHRSTRTHSIDIARIR